MLSRSHTSAPGLYPNGWVAPTNNMFRCNIPHRLFAAAAGLGCAGVFTLPLPLSALPELYQNSFFSIAIFPAPGFQQSYLRRRSQTRVYEPYACPGESCVDLQHYIIEPRRFKAFSWSREGLRPTYLAERAQADPRCCSTLCCQARRARAIDFLHLRPPASSATTSVATCCTAMSPCVTPEDIEFSSYQRITNAARFPTSCGNSFLGFRAPTGTNIRGHPGFAAPESMSVVSATNRVFLASLSHGFLSGDWGRSPVSPVPSFLGSLG